MVCPSEGELRGHERVHEKGDGGRRTGKSTQLECTQASEEEHHAGHQEQRGNQRSTQQDGLVLRHELPKGNSKSDDEQIEQPCPEELLALAKVRAGNGDIRPRVSAQQLTYPNQAHP